MVKGRMMERWAGRAGETALPALPAPSLTFSHGASAEDPFTGRRRVAPREREADARRTRVGERRDDHGARNKGRPGARRHSSGWAPHQGGGTSPLSAFEQTAGIRDDEIGPAEASDGS